METTPPRPSRIKKIFRGAVFVVAALITLAALFVAEEHWRGARAWRNYKNEMEAKGERFDAARLIPTNVPDGENFGACPYLEHPFATSAGGPGWTNLNGFLPSPGDWARHPGWAYGLSTDLPYWAAAFQDRKGHGAGAEKTDPTQAAHIIIDCMKAMEPVLGDLRAASLRRYCRFDVPYKEWASPEIEQAAGVTMEHLSEVKVLCRILVLHAEAEMVAGKRDEALADVNLMFHLDDGLMDEPLIISELVRYSCLAILLEPIAEGLAEHRWSDAQLRGLEERLGRTDVLASTVRAFYGERDILGNPPFRSSSMALLGWDRLEQLNLDHAFHEVLLPRVDLVGWQINPAVGRACDLAMSNYTEGGQAGIFIHHRMMAAMTMPVFFNAPSKAAFLQTQVDLVRVGCALERYHLAEGVYPEKLEALTPRFIAALPHDIINGQALKYRLAGNGKFVLYSVGWNMRDDGGVTVMQGGGNRHVGRSGGAPARENPGVPDPKQGDWVLEYPE